MRKLFQLVVFVLVLIFAAVAWRSIYRNFATSFMHDSVHTSIHQDSAQTLPSAPLHPLAPDEHCVGGVVIRVDKVNGVTTYTQQMDGTHPMACSGG